MVEGKPLTETSLVAALKKVGLATKDDVRILSAKVSNIEKNMVTKAEFDSQMSKASQERATIERSLKGRMSKQHKDAMAATARVATNSPTTQQFN